MKFTVQRWETDYWQNHFVLAPEVVASHEEAIDWICIRVWNMNLPRGKYRVLDTLDRARAECGLPLECNRQVSFSTGPGFASHHRLG